MDIMNELDAGGIIRYQNFTSKLVWEINLGCTNINMEGSCMLQHPCSPQEGHLDSVCQIFRHLNVNLKENPGRIVFNGTLEKSLESLFEIGTQDKEKWKGFYPDADELEPLREPDAIENSMVIRVYVDVNNTGNMLNMRSHTGILIYVNNTSMIWFSKRKNTVEYSSSRSKLIYLSIAMKMVEALRYEIIIISILIDVPADFFYNNQSVVKNMIITTSTFNIIHNAI